MYCTDGRSVTATSRARWKARLAQAAPLGCGDHHGRWLDAGASSALVRLRAVRGEKTYVDYLLLARLGMGWRIVGKLCQASAQGARLRARPSTRPSTGSWRPTGAGTTACSATSVDPRALVMTVEDGELVVAGLPEWQARYRDRRGASAGNVFDVASRLIDARGDIGVARWSFRSASGEWTDRALVMKTPEGWRVMALMFARRSRSREVRRTVPVPVGALHRLLTTSPRLPPPGGTWRRRVMRLPDLSRRALASMFPPPARETTTFSRIVAAIVFAFAFPALVLSQAIIWTDDATAFAQRAATAASGLVAALHRSARCWAGPACDPRRASFEVRRSP